MADFGFEDFLRPPAGGLGTPDDDTFTFGFPTRGSAGVFTDDLGFDAGAGFDQFIVEGIVDIRYSELKNFEQTVIRGGEFAVGELIIDGSRLDDLGELRFGEPRNTFEPNTLRITDFPTSYDGLALAPTITAEVAQTIRVTLDPVIFDEPQFGLPVITYGGGALSLDFSNVTGPEGTTFRFDLFADADRSPTLSRLTAVSPARETSLSINAIGSALDDLIEGGEGGNTIDGRAGDDRLVGGELDDLLIGGEGDDRLEGRHGSNTYIGGTGNDIIDLSLPSVSVRDTQPDFFNTIVFSPGDGEDTVLNANLLTFGGQRGAIDLSGFSEEVLQNAYANRTIVPVGSSTNMVLDFGNGDRLILEGGNDERIPETVFIGPGFNAQATAVRLENIALPNLPGGGVTTRVKVADIVAVDTDETTLVVRGPAASFFEIVGLELFLQAGQQLPNFDTGLFAIEVVADGGPATALTLPIAAPNQAAQNASFSGARTSISDDGSEGGILGFLRIDDPDGETEVSLTGEDADLVVFEDGELRLADEVQLDATVDGELNVGLLVDGIEISVSVPVIDADGGSVIAFGGTPVFQEADFFAADPTPSPAVVIREDGSLTEVDVTRGGSFRNTESRSATGGTAVAIWGLGSNTIENASTLTVSGADSVGVGVINSGVIRNSGSISANGTETVGLFLTGSGEATNAAGGTITVSGTEAAGIFMEGNGAVLNEASGVINASGTESAAVFLEGTGTAVNAGAINISGTGLGAIGVGGEGSVDVANTGEITLSSTFGAAATVLGNGRTLQNEGNITLAGTLNLALGAVGSNNVIIHRGTITGDGPANAGIGIAGNAGETVIVGSGDEVLSAGEITLTGPESAAIIMASDNGKLQVTAPIISTGADGFGLVGFGTGLKFDLDADLTVGAGTAVQFGAERFNTIFDLSGTPARDNVLAVGGNVRALTPDGSTFFDGLGSNIRITNEGREITGFGTGFSLTQAAGLGFFRLTNETGGSVSVDSMFDVTANEVQITNNPEASFQAEDLGMLGSVTKLELQNDGTIDVGNTGMTVTAFENPVDYKVINTGDIAAGSGTTLNFEAEDVEGGTQSVTNEGTIENVIGNALALAGGETAELSVVNDGDITALEEAVRFLTGAEGKVELINRGTIIGDIVLEGPEGDQTATFDNTETITGTILINQDNTSEVGALAGIDSTLKLTNREDATLANTEDQLIRSVGHALEIENLGTFSASGTSGTSAIEADGPAVRFINAQGAAFTNEDGGGVNVFDTAGLATVSDKFVLVNQGSMSVAGSGLAVDATASGRAITAIGNSGALSVSGENAAGLFLIGNGASGQSLSAPTGEDLTLLGTVVGTNDGAHVVNVSGGTIDLSGGTARGISLATTSDAYVSNDGRITGLGPDQVGMLVEGGPSPDTNTVFNLGEIELDGSNAKGMSVSGNGTNVRVGQGALVVNIDGDTFEASDLFFDISRSTSDVSLFPAGKIAVSGSNSVGLSLSGSNITAGLASGLSADTNAADRGAIVATGAGSVGVELLADNGRFINAGVVSGESAAIRGSDTSQRVINLGDINGAVQLLGGADEYQLLFGVENTGPVDGGSGNDTLRLFSGVPFSDRVNPDTVPALDLSRFTNFELLEVFGGGAAIVTGTFTGPLLRITDSGTQLFLDDAVVPEIVASSGIVTGRGTVGNLTINEPAVLAPGSSPGSITVTGDLIVRGTLDLEIGGTALGERDRLIVEGNTDLSDATIRISFIDGYTPDDGLSFSLVESASPITGLDTANIELGDVPDGVALDFNPDGSVSVSEDNGGGNPTPTLEAANDTATVDEDGTVTIDVLENDTLDATASLTDVGMPGFGTAEIVEGQVRYTPDGDFNGTDSFDYTISDGEGGTDTGTVSVTVTAVNDTPVAGDDSAGTASGTSVDIDVLGNDIDVDGDSLAVSTVGTPPNGTADVNPDGTLSYTPAAGFSGTDTFSYTVVDGNGGTDTATVTVVVNGGNDDPVAADDVGVEFTTNEDTPFTTGNVLTNDTDDDGDTLSVVDLDTSGTRGLVTDNGDGTFDYDPNGAFEDLRVTAATDSFGYTVSDGQGGTDTATVTIIVNGVNDAPEAQDDSLRAVANETLFANVFADNANGPDADIDGGPLRVTAVNGSTTSVGATTLTSLGAVVVLGGDGMLTYRPESANFAVLGGNETLVDSFTYTITDVAGETDTATVTITVAGENRAPIALNDSGEASPATPADIDVLANDMDADGDTLSVAEVGPAANGTTEINPDGTLRYTPNDGFDGTDSFTYTASDGNGGTDTATVTVTVNGTPNLPPVVSDNTTRGSFSEDFSRPTLNLLDPFFVTDPEDDPLTISNLTVTAEDGRLLTGGFVPRPPLFNSDGPVYALDGGQFEDLSDGQRLRVTYDFTVSDGVNEVAAQAVFVAFGVNDAPEATNDSGNGFSTDSVTAFTTANVLGNDTDIDANDVLTIASFDATGTRGLVTDNGDGTFGYDPNGAFADLGAGESVTDQFTYTISDGNGGTSSAIVEIVVSNDAVSPGFNLIEGTDRAFETLVGTDGNDLIIGKGGGDQIYARAGNDRIDPGSGNDWTVFGGAGNDTFVLNLGSQNTRIRDFEDGVDRIELAGGLEFDDLTFVFSATSNATNIFTPDGDRLILSNVNIGDVSADDFVSDQTLNLIEGTDRGFETLTGTDTGDLILGKGGSDQIYAGAGDDRIDAGRGNDWTVFGGEGADTFVFNLGSQNTRVRDFEDGFDQIELGVGLEFEDLQISFSASVNAVNILTPEGDRLILSNTTLDQILENDFILTLA